MPFKSEQQRKAMYAAAEGKSNIGIPKSVGEKFIRHDSDIADCAGILFQCGQRFLLCKRSDTGEWEQPGGHLKEGESIEDGALRECLEEIGPIPKGTRSIVEENEIPGGTYTVLLQQVSKEFKPHLNDEHSEYVWATPDDLPSPMLPPVEQCILMLQCKTELDVAKAIQSGRLASPQKYDNVWLFDIRITGTGTSYREAHSEYVVRPPEEFLTDEFVQRCNGLPVIFEHPDTGILDTEEYRERAIGSVFIPYIKNDEVWAIVKVFDDDAAQLMQSSHISTSPAVVFRNAGSTETIELDGDTVLVEGKPSLLDHIAICEHGVWDKGEAPSGVTLTDKQEVPEMDKEEMKSLMRELMAEIRADAQKSSEKEEEEEVKADSEEEKEEEVKADEDKEEKEEKEEAKEEVKADESEPEAKKSEEEKKMEYADSAKEAAELRAQIQAMNAKIESLNKPLSSADRDALSRAQARADGVAQMFGEEVAAPLNGESPIAYRKRLADKLKKHSRELKDVRMDSMDEASFAVLENKIYADAQAAALSPTAARAGQLIPIVRRDSAGRQVTTFQGDIDAWMKHFKAPGMGVKIDRTLGKGA